MKGTLRNMPPMWEGAPVYTTQPFLRLGETRPLSRQTAEIDGLVLEGLTYVSREIAQSIIDDLLALSPSNLSVAAVEEHQLDRGVGFVEETLRVTRSCPKQRCSEA
jgi:hypothetical protein